jgi:histidinol-phosphate phosphatase family protein
MNKALFLDRDGTIIIDKNYLFDPAEVEFLPGAFDFLQKAQQNDYLCFIVTNQSGVGRGLFPVSAILKVHQKMNKMMLQNGLKEFTGLSFCPHSPEDLCPCRKPKNAMLVELISKWKISIESSIMIGDKKSDVDCGQSLGVKSYLLEKNTKLKSLANSIFL